MLRGMYATRSIINHLLDLAQDPVRVHESRDGHAACGDHYRQHKEQRPLGHFARAPSFFRYCRLIAATAAFSVS